MFYFIEMYGRVKIVNKRRIEKGIIGKYEGFGARHMTIIVDIIAIM